MSPEDSKHGSTQVLGLGLAATLVVSAVVGGLALGAATLTPADGVSAVQEEDDGPPLVRFAHASPDALPVNVTINDQQVLTNRSFGNVSDYLRVTSGTHTVTVTIARTGTEGEVLFEDTLTVEQRTRFTVVVAGEWTAPGEGTVQPVVLEDNLTARSENESDLRLSHFSPDAPPVDVAIQGTDRVLFDNVSYNDTTDYVSVPAGNHTLEVREATPDGTGDVITTVNVSLEGGDAYAAFAVGYLEPEAAIVDTPFDVVVAGPTVSEPSPETMITPTPLTTPTETAGNETEGTETGG